MTPEEVQLKDDYRALGLDPGATPVEVKRAFRALAKTCHPDRFQLTSYEVRAQAEEKFKRINQAYGRISRTWVKLHSPERKVPSGPASSVRKRAATASRLARWTRVIDTVSHGRAARLFLLAIIIAALIFIGRTDYSPPGVEMGGNQASVPEPESTSPKSGIRPAEPSVELETHTGGLLSESLTVPEPPASLLERLPDSSLSYFTIGSHGSDVLRIQGSPSRIQGQTWVYGLSEIQFRNGQVQRYNNFDGSLRVRMLPRESGDSPPTHLSLGSTEDDVLHVQGTPTRVEQDKWYYGFSEIKFKDGRVCDFNNYFGNLKFRLQPASEPGVQKGYFTIGSSPDEVIAAQGTPTSIQGSVWTYDFAYVFFRDGKVSSVSSASDSLRFLTPEDPVDSSSKSTLKNSGS